MQLLFTDEDIRLFSRASGDRNPLHNDPVFAARSSFGQPVVFGVLGAIAALGTLAAPRCRRIRSVRAEFHRPLFRNVPYSVEHSESLGSVVIRVKDGSVPMSTLQCQLAPDEQPVTAVNGRPNFSLETARTLSWADLQKGMTTSGTYHPDSDALRCLTSKWSVSAVPASLLSGLLWSSYFIGMEVPGRDALFFSLNLSLTSEPQNDAALSYEATIQDKIESRNQLRLTASLRDSAGELANARLVAFVRPDINRTSTYIFKPSLSVDQRSPLSGKIAAVVGASRGFGAALSIALASKGVRVLACSRSQPEWLGGLDSEIREHILPQLSDASDGAALSAIASRARADLGRIDMLICSAFPAVPSLRFEPNYVARMNTYLAQANSLVTAPLCAFLPSLRESRGCLVLISSTAVENPVREWPHYVAAKASAEALARVAGLQYPEIAVLIFRPDRMRTEMINTPMGRVGAAAPEEVARELIGHLETGPKPGSVSVIPVGSQR